MAKNSIGYTRIKIEIIPDKGFEILPVFYCDSANRRLNPTLVSAVRKERDV